MNLSAESSRHLDSHETAGSVFLFFSKVARRRVAAGVTRDGWSHHAVADPSLWRIEIERCRFTSGSKNRRPLAGDYCQKVRYGDDYWETGLKSGALETGHKGDINRSLVNQAHHA